MKRTIFTALLLLSFAFKAVAQPIDYIWETQSKNSSESMPCGGGDIGLNVWVENGDILFYISRSGAFDENNTLLKQGRIRLKLNPNPFNSNVGFKQILHLNDGYVSVTNGRCVVDIWVDVFKPVVHVEINGKEKSAIEVGYESWRYKDRALTKTEAQQCSYKWIVPKDGVTKADLISAKSDNITFYHRNSDITVFDMAVEQQGLSHVKDSLYNPIKGLITGGKLIADGMVFSGEYEGSYGGTDYKGWRYKSVGPLNSHNFNIILNETQNGLDDWNKGLASIEKSINSRADKIKTRKWWNEFWKRSYINGGGELTEQVRNYTLFRYMLGCNAYSKWPTKFNGGLFTFDPIFVDEKSPFTPDYRRWGGGTMTAQNQRLVYWPMLKSGDFDMMKSEFDCYMRILPNAIMRTKVYWNHGGACFCEQIENFGLPNPAEYGSKRPDGFDKGVEYNPWLEYEWDTVLEFCQMILEFENYNNEDLERYYPLIENALNFFDEHYRYVNKKFGNKELDGKGKLVLYPGSACETYKMAYNPSSTIAALTKLSQSYKKDLRIKSHIPEIPLRTVGGKEMIAPAMAWQRINNVETPQLYPVFPWRLYGIGRDNIEIAKNTYLYDEDALKFRSSEGWKQDNIWAACLGLTEEATRLTKEKMKNGPYRFPAFWGPDFDWSPDHNRGGSGIIGLQEMLMQEVDGKIYLFPAWDKKEDISFKLHASQNTIVEVELKKGEVKINVFPEERRESIVVL